MPPSCEHCHHDATIERLKQHDDHMMEIIREMREDIKSIRQALESNQSIKLEHSYHKEGLARAFERIEALEKADREKTEMIHQMIGMKKLAWTLWSVLASGLGIVIFKLFIIAGAH